MDARLFWKGVLRARPARPARPAKRPRRWVDRETAAEERAKNWSRLSAGAAGEGCRGEGFVLVPPLRDVNGGYGYRAQCSKCLRKMTDVGWGECTDFSDDDNREICALLNEFGAPFNADGAISVMHFHASALRFHRALSEKSWPALVGHVRSEFTTTTSAPRSALTGYRGWYHVPSGICAITR